MGAQYNVMARSFLFLQGVCSPFFSKLGSRLRAEGQEVFKVNFNAGDAAMWRAGSATSWREPLHQLPGFYEDFYRKNGVTDIVLFGDQRPVHKPAIELARASGIRTHVYEEGYFRPFWLTLERDGVNANSRLPKDADWYREVGKQVPRYRNGQAFPSSFAIRTWHDIAYNVCGLKNRWSFPHYRGHAPTGAWEEYGAYLRRGWRLRGRDRRDTKAINDLIRNDKVFYLLPLQLDSDAQIREHSQFGNMAELLAVVMASFAHNASAESMLVVKNHPLDPGLVHHEATALALARQFDIEQRVVFLETGHMPTLLANVTGVITVNSTVGGSALLHACPTIALSQPIYAIPGLTFQGPLDAFWRDHQRPDMTLFHHFRNTVIHTTQVNGGFYSRQGISMAVDNSISRLLADQSLLDGLS